MSLLRFFLASLSWAAVAYDDDAGFEDLFLDSLGEVYPEECTTPTGLPSFLDGAFVMASTSQYSMGGKHVNSWLDAYWKLHVVKLKNGLACYKTRLIKTGFYNKSVAEGTVSSGVLFSETTPPRHCFAGGVCNMFGAPNDNNFATSYRMKDGVGGYRYALMTDTEVHLDFDVETLKVIGKRTFRDNFAKFGHVQKGGGTHLQCEAGRGTSASDCHGDLFGVVYEQGASNMVDLYRLRAGNPEMRELVAHIAVPWAPGSLHSFALTQDFAIIPLSPFTIDGPSMLWGKDIMHSITSKGTSTPIFLVNLHDGSVKQVTFPEEIYYVHIVNSWQNETHLVFDASSWDRQPFGFNNPAMVLSVLRNKTARDSATNSESVRRYAIDIASHVVTQQWLTDGPGLIDFPKVSPNKYGKEHCIYYGVEWKHNGVDYGSWALRKHDICTGQVIFHHEPSTYLSEPVFVPDGGPNEDDGVILTIRTGGLTKESHFLVLDAKTMKEVSQTKLKYMVGWYAHGSYFPNEMSSLLVV